MENDQNNFRINRLELFSEQKDIQPSLLFVMEIARHVNFVSSEFNCNVDYFFSET